MKAFRFIAAVYTRFRILQDSLQDLTSARPSAAHMQHSISRLAERSRRGAGNLACFLWQSIWMHAPSGEFNLTRLERVIYGPGKIKELGAEAERRGLSRVLVVTTLGGFPILDQVTGALGARCAGAFTGIVQHVPRGTVDALQAEIERVNADCLVSFGGGSPIDSCKVAIHGVSATRELVHIAVPTTLSAAEYTSAGGVTDESTRVKGGVWDARVAPRTVINDPALTMDTPDWLWRRWTAVYGEESARAIARVHQGEPPLDLTVKNDAPGWAEKLGGIVLPTGSVRLVPSGSRRAQHHRMHPIKVKPQRENRI